MSLKQVISSGFKAMAGIQTDKHKDSSVVKLITSTVNALDTAITAMDKFLKTKNIDIGKAASYSKNKATTGLDWINAKVKKVIKKKDPTELKENQDSENESKVGLIGKFRSFMTSGTEPPTGGKPSILNRLKGLNPFTKGDTPEEEIEGKLDDANNLTKETNEGITDVGTKLDELIKVTKESGSGDGLDATGKKKAGWWSKLKDRMGGRKEEIDEEKENAKNRLKKKEPSWLGKILKKVMWLGGAVFTAFKAITSIGVEKILGGLWKATVWTARLLGKVTLKALRWLGPKLWEGTKWLGKKTWEGTKWLGAKAWEGLKWVGNKIFGGVKSVGTKVYSLGVKVLSLPMKIASGLKGILIGAFRGAVKGIGSLFSGSIGKLGGTILSGIKNFGLTMLDKVKSLIPGAKLLEKGGKFLAASKTFLKKALPAVGTFLAKRAIPLVGRAAAFLFTGPVGWAIGIGMLAWDGYKLYKYIVRNGIPDTVPGKLIRLKLLSYGFNDESKSDYSKIFELEEVIGSSFIHDSKTNTVNLGEVTEKQTARVMNIFEVDPKNEARVEKLNRWFNERFIPAYGAYLQALWTIDPKLKPGDADKLTNEQVTLLLDVYRCPTDIFDLRTLPMAEDLESTVMRDELDTLILSIRNDIKSGKNTKHIAKKADDKIKQQVKANTEAEKARREAEIRRKEALINKENTTQPVTSKVPLVTPTDAETKPTGGAGGSANTSGGSDTSKASNQRVNLAAGDLLLGDSSHEGIRLNTKLSSLTSLDPQVYALFTGMAKEYKQLTGKDIQLNEGFRTYADQMALRKKYPGKAALPGNSMHEFGLAVDINTPDVAALDRMGLLRKYGFTGSVGGETWHLEPIGVSLDPTGAKHNATIRQRAIESSPGRGGGGWGLVKGSKMASRNMAHQQKIFNSEVAPSEPLQGVDLLSARGGGNYGSQTGTQSEVAGGSTNSSNFGYNPFAAVGKATTSTSPVVSEPSYSSTNTGTSTTLPPPVDGETKPTEGTGQSQGKLHGYGDGSLLMMGSKSSTLDAGAGSANMDVLTAIKQASKMTGVDYETMIAFGKLESGLKPGAKASTSSATGLFQFTRETWDWMLSEHGKKYGLTANADRNNPLHNSLMAAEYIKFNSRLISRHAEAGLDKPMALYLAHWLGGTGAKNLIAKHINNPHTPMSSAVDAGQYKANASAMHGRTTSQFLQALKERWRVASNTSTSAYGAGTASSTPASGFGSGDGSALMASINTTSQTGGSGSGGGGGTQSGLAGASYNPFAAVQPTSTSTGGSVDTSGPSAPTITSSGMESILDSQLLEMSKMVSLLASIDGKLGGNTSNIKPGNKSQETKPTQTVVSAPVKTTSKVKTDNKTKLDHTRPAGVSDEVHADWMKEQQQRINNADVNAERKKQDDLDYERRKAVILADAAQANKGKPPSSSVNVSRRSMSVDIDNY